MNRRYFIFGVTDIELNQIGKYGTPIDTSLKITQYDGTETIITLITEKKDERYARERKKA